LPMNLAMQLRVKVRPHFEEDHICKLRKVSKELNLYDVILRQSKAEQWDSVSCCCMTMTCPPLWSSGQSSWLQILGPGSIPGTTKKVLGLERGPLSLVSTTEGLFDRKVAAPV
jgi:hypothetical protein